MGGNSHLTSVTHSGGIDTEFEYFDEDLGFALKKILSKFDNQEIARHDYTYDLLGRIQTWKRRAPLANPGTTHEYEWTMTHDFTSQLTGVVEKSLSGTLRGGWTYGYDSGGNRYSSMHTGTDGSAATATTATHNNMNQITGIGGGGRTKVAGTLNEPGKVSVGIAGQGTRPARMLPDNRFEADLDLPAGNNTLAIEAVDNSGNHSSYRYSVAVDSQATSAPTYDTDGNMTSDGVRAYDWDSLNRLKIVTWAEGVTTEFKYNALGQRVERIETDGPTVVHHYYLYDGIYLVERRTGTDPDNATTDRRFFPSGEQRWNGTAWQSFYYCRDHLGCVREVLASDGTLAARYDYTPYGERIARYEDSGYTTCDLGFTGHITLPSHEAGENELVLTHFRAYNPAPGNWISADPLGEGGGINLYVYADGQPAQYFDLLGLDLTAGDSELAALLQRTRKLDPRIEKLVSALEKSTHKNCITRASSPNMPYSCSTAGNATEAKSEKNGVGIAGYAYVSPNITIESKYQKGVKMTPEEILTHELQHVYDMNNGVMDRECDDDGVQRSEKRGVQTQNIVRKVQQPKAPLRNNYAGKEFRGFQPENSPIK